MPKFLVAFMLLWALLLGACARPVAYTGESNGVVATVSVSKPLLANESIPVTITFAQDGAPFPVADVAVELLMPGMTMGKSVPLADAQADGSHTTKVLFTMDGEWALVVTGKSSRGAERFVVHGLVVAP